MGEADLIVPSRPSHLAPIAVRHPIIGAEIAEEFLDHLMAREGSATKTALSL